ncbi:hypothetical protein BRC86_04760 [Halobacteriales archaeon QS_3_64_16]|nr:MAG: hypothetical protein BRC86_04760 [Halobacteriales archaeon QS_3_64_16]
MITAEEEPGDELASLDRGETYAIRAAREQDVTVVLDDGPARDRADDLGAPLLDRSDSWSGSFAMACSPKT